MRLSSLLRLLWVVGVHGLVAPSASRVKRLRGGSLQAAPGGDVVSVVSGAVQWLNGMRVPGTLVAGSALTCFLTFSKELAVTESDSFLVKTVKRLSLALLFSSFYLEIFLVFGTTVTSTWLQSTTFRTTASSAMAFMHSDMELEYVGTRFLFLQGLFGWLGGVALKFLLPSLQDSTPKADKHLSRFYARAILALVLMMIHYFHRHTDFYTSYFDMSARFFALVAERLWPPNNPLLMTATLSALWALLALLRAAKADFDDSTDIKADLDEYIANDSPSLKK